MHACVNVVYMSSCTKLHNYVPTVYDVILANYALTGLPITQLTFKIVSHLELHAEKKVHV